MKLLVFGEILWDVFPDKKELGGAPLNFACHASLLGATPYIVSAVGNDSEGDAALASARAYGVDVSYVTRVGCPTGMCRVTLKDGVPSYELVKPTAYDRIARPLDAGFCDAFYFGTLAQRDEVSRTSLRSLLRDISRDGKEIFFDINIRQSFYNADTVRKSLEYATVLKISRDEAHVFGELGIVPASADTLYRSLSAEYPQLKYIIMTLDKDGAEVYDCKNARVLRSPKPVGKPVSTVGGGDSFSACFFVNYLNGEDIAVCLERAVALSDYIVTVLGAVCEYPDDLKRRLGLCR